MGIFNRLVLGLALAAIGVSLGFVFLGSLFFTTSEKMKFFVEILFFCLCICAVFLKFHLGKRSESEEQLERIVDYSNCVLGTLFVFILYVPFVVESSPNKVLGIVGGFLLPVSVLAIEVFVSPNLWEQYE